MGRQVIDEIKQARKVLGKTAEKLTDGEIKTLITNVDLLVNEWLELHESRIFGQPLMTVLERTKI